MDTTVITPPFIGSAHSFATVVSVKVTWFEDIGQVGIDFIGHDGIGAFNVLLDPAAAFTLGGQLAAAVDAVEGHWQPASDAVTEERAHRAAVS